MSTHSMRLHYLFDRYCHNICSQEELNEFWALLNDHSGDDMLSEDLKKLWHKQRTGPLASDNVNWEKIAGTMQSRIEAAEIDYSKFTVVPIWKRPMVAAAAILILIAGTAFWFLQNKPAEPGAIASATHDVAPGMNGAILTLADGKKIILDSTGNGQLTIEGNTKITKHNDGLAYTAGTENTNATSFNTLSTPRARQFQLTLPDGTHVWLNAASSITYPTAFTGKKREVTVTGEVYFEVVHNTSTPFIVAVNEATIQVFGTNFNVNAYPDEAAVRTTLLEGSVKVTNALGSVMIKPGEQANITDQRNSIKVLTDPDIDQVMAWKNGEFAFNNTSVESILQQAARWYDVDIVMEAKIKEGFTVNVSRNVPISKLLKSMEVSGGVHFEVDGRTIRVRP
jgi:transmembrane sensor